MVTRCGPVLSSFHDLHDDEMVGFPQSTIFRKIKIVKITNNNIE
jgi:hypothetical protein